MKIVADENIPFVREMFSDYGDVITFPGRSITRNIIEDATILLVRSVTPVTQALLEGTSVRFVATATIGIDHIDIEYLKSNNIGFAYAPGSNAESVAEYVLSALMMLSSQLKKPLSSMMLGVIGAGNVGSRVFHHAEILGMDCLLNDPPKKKLTGSDIYLSLDEVLMNSDIVTIHVPLTLEGEDATVGMVNEEFLSKMKKGAVLINTSRGNIIDEHALKARRSSLGGCILDVWQNEPSIDIETLELSTIGTPHIAGYSFDGKIRGAMQIYHSACAYFFKRPAWNLPDETHSESADVIDVRRSSDPFVEAVSRAYPIVDEDMRKFDFLEKSDDERPAYFDSLRKNYRRRFEFSHFLVICSKNQSREALILSELNFKVEIK
jgi:erythronate-4-phosphate dehydrogenase